MAAGNSDLSAVADKGTWFRVTNAALQSRNNPGRSEIGAAADLGDLSALSAGQLGSVFEPVTGGHVEPILFDILNRRSFSP